LAALLELDLHLSESSDPQALLEKSAGAAREIIGANYAAAGTLESGSSEIRFFVTSGMQAGMAETQTPRCDRSTSSDRR